MAVKSGDPCPMGCGGTVYCRTSRRVSDNSQEQTLVCKTDGCEFKTTIIVKAMITMRRVVLRST